MKKTTMMSWFAGALAVGIVTFGINTNTNYNTFKVDPTSLVGMQEADAKSFRSSSFRSSSSRSFSFSSSSRKSSGSKGLWNRSSSKKTVSTTSSKPKSTTPSKSANASTQKSFKSTGGTQSSRKASSTPSRPKNVVERRQTGKGFEQYRKSNSQFKSKPTTPRTATSATNTRTKNSLVTKKFGNKRYSYDDVNRNRARYYGNWDRPTYIYGGSPYYGAWDSTFLWFMMANNPSFFYHHNNSSEIREFRAEANRLAQDNAELRGQLAQLDRQVNGMSGPRNAEYLPEGVDPTVAFAADVAVAAPADGTIRVGTGGKTGMYYAFCQELKAQYAKTECVNTNGSVENSRGLQNGSFDAVTMQSNLLTGNEAGLQSSLYPEVVFLLANEQSGVDAIGDIRNKHNLIVAGGGAYATLQNFANEDGGYKRMLKNATKAQATQDVVTRIANDPNGVMMFVCAVNCPLISYANQVHGSKLQLAAVDDWDFNDVTNRAGDRLYRFVDIDPESYNQLSQDGWFSDGSVETLAVEAVFVVDTAWTERNGTQAQSELESAMWIALTNIQKRAGLPVE